MQPPAILPDVPQVRQDMANFKAAARVLDDSMGAVFQALARNGLEENTLERGHSSRWRIWPIPPLFRAARWFGNVAANR